MSKKLLSLPAKKRDATGKGACRKLRASGYIPAVFYTPEGKNMAVTVKESDLARVYKVVGRTAIFNLELEDEGKSTTHPSIVWDAEYYPTKQRFQHIDFYGVDLDKEIKIRVPITITGTSRGVKAGGKIEVYRDRIYILGKPGDLPQFIEVDITKLKINEGLRIADLPMPAGIRAHYTDNFAVLSILLPSATLTDEEEETVAEGTPEATATEE